MQRPPAAASAAIESAAGGIGQGTAQQHVELRAKADHRLTA